MKKGSLILGLAVILSFSNVMIGNAKTSYYLTNSNTSQNISSEDLRKTIIKSPRGMYISSGTLQISNEGHGEIGVYMNTLAHQGVASMTFGIFLERWIESEQRWANVGDYSFEFKQEDNPDEELTMKVISFNVVGQPADCYYRLSGIHRVKAVDGRTETLYSKTDGILITDN